MKGLYRKGIKGENDVIVAAINQGFSDVRVNLDFRVSMPKVYHQQQHLEDIHHLIVEEQTVVAAAANLRETFFIHQHPFKTAYVGSVSVIPQRRHLGYMKILMEKVMTEIQQQNVDVAILSGQRQRYERYGFYQAGYYYQAHVHLDNVKDLNQEEAYTFREITDPLDPAIASLYQFYLKNDVVKRKQETFLFESQSHQLRLYEITAHTNEIIGYLLYRDSSQLIAEYELSHLANPFFLLRDFLAFKKIESAYIDVMPWELNKLRALSTRAENISVQTRDHMKVYQFQTYIETWLLLTSKHRKLMPGTLVLEIKDHGIFEISVKDNYTKCQSTTKKPDISLSEADAIVLLTRPMTDLFDVNTFNWFPLMFSIPLADSF